MRHEVARYITGVEDGETVFHIIKFGWHYWQVSSLNAFFDRMVQACLRSRGNSSEWDKHSWGRSTEFSFNRSMERNPSRKVVYHESVWDFYEHIGYWYQKSSMKKVVWKQKG